VPLAQLERAQRLRRCFERPNLLDLDAAQREPLELGELGERRDALHPAVGELEILERRHAAEGRDVGQIVAPRQTERLHLGHADKDLEVVEVGEVQPQSGAPAAARAVDRAAAVSGLSGNGRP
jgi:hypothetical protein